MLFMQPTNKAALSNMTVPIPITLTEACTGYMDRTSDWALISGAKSSLKPSMAGSLSLDIGLGATSPPISAIRAFLHATSRSDVLSHAAGRLCSHTPFARHQTASMKFCVMCKPSKHVQARLELRNEAKPGLLTPSYDCLIIECIQAGTECIQGLHYGRTLAESVEAIICLADPAHAACETTDLIQIHS